MKKPREGKVSAGLKDAQPGRRHGPTDEQLCVLEAFRAAHGRHWKARLRDLWLTGRDAARPGGALLRQIRNTFGPRWLQEYQPGAWTPPPVHSTAAACRRGGQS